MNYTGDIVIFSRPTVSCAVCSVLIFLRLAPKVDLMHSHASKCETFQEEVHLGSALHIFPFSTDGGFVSRLLTAFRLWSQIAIDGLRFEAVYGENFILSVVGGGEVRVLWVFRMSSGRVFLEKSDAMVRGRAASLDLRKTEFQHYA